MGLANIKLARPRILLVSGADIVAGGEIYYIKLAKVLLQHYELGAVLFNPALQAEFDNMGIRIWRGEILQNPASPQKYILIAKHLRIAFREFSPDLVHLNGGAEGYLAPIPWLMGIPSFITNHILRKASRSSVLKRLVLWASTQCATTTVCVSATAQHNLQNYAWAKKTIVIPNWIDIVPGEYSRPVYDRSRPFRLLFVGRIESEKGIYDLIEAIKSLCNVHLDIVGEGPGLTRAIDTSAGLPVYFHGFKRDVATFYKDADLLIFPSHSEGQGLVLIEAMSYGLPCVASDIGAVLETTGNGQFVETFRCGDTCDLAKKIHAMQNDSNRLAYLSEHGRRHALRTYTEERISHQYINLIRSIIQRPGDTRHFERDH